MKGLIKSVSSYFEGDPNNQHLPAVEQMDSFLPPEWCKLQIALARNHQNPEPFIAELGHKKAALEKRIATVEEEEKRMQAEYDAQQEINGGRMTLREKLKVAGFILTLPISLPILFASAFDAAAKGSKMMKCNLAFLEKLEAELLRSQKRKSAIAGIDAELDSEMVTVQAGKE